MSFPDIKLLKKIADMQIQEFKEVRQEPKSYEDTEHNRKKDRGKDLCP